jgi:hypothetical protein
MQERAQLQIGQTGQNPVSSATVKFSRRNGSDKSVTRKSNTKERKEYLKALEADARAFVIGFRRAKGIDKQTKVVHRKFKDVVTEMLPVFVRVRFGFAHLRKGETVMGERTGTAWAERYIGLSYYWLCRCLNRASAGTLPVTEEPESDHGPEQGEIQLPELTQRLTTNPPADTANWTDNTYIHICVEFIGCTLEPLDSDPQRFHRVAVAIAHEILDEASSPDDGIVVQDCELAAVNE